MSDDETFINQKMITYLGNKRKLIPEIEAIVQQISKELNKEKLNIFDAFAGSSVVSRLFTKYSEILYSNDIELYSYIINYCFLVRPSYEQIIKIQFHIQKMNHIANNGPYKEGIICKLYSPKDTFDIKSGERCFYTHENALIIDTLRNYIQENVEKELFNYCITPLLIQASIHVNTSGQFKGFHKNKETGLGQWGGSAENDLKRILGRIQLELPIWSKYQYNPTIIQEDTNILLKNLRNDFDIIYLDPPYNQHGYSNNYYMFNIIIENKEPKDISLVSGIPKDWKRSLYNYNKSAIPVMKDLIETSLQKTKYIILSYNNEGIINKEDWDQILEPYNVEKKEIPYDTYKGSRNLKKRDNKVIEIMYIIRRN